MFSLHFTLFPLTVSVFYGSVVFLQRDEVEGEIQGVVPASRLLC